MNEAADNATPPRLRLELAGSSHAGNKREVNEDSFGLLAAHSAAIVADGMGGLSHGDEASRTVVAHFLDAMHHDSDPASALMNAHAQIAERSRIPGQRMGSTVVCAYLDGAAARVLWAGDSRLYRWNGSELQQVTRDHSFVQEMVDRGALTLEEAEKHPNRNVVTRAIGARADEPPKIDSVTLPVQVDDRLLLCSDGLCGFLPEARIAELLSRHADPDACCSRLIEATLSETDAGDNVTVVVARVRG